MRIGNTIVSAYALAIVSMFAILAMFSFGPIEDSDAATEYHVEFNLDIGEYVEIDLRDHIDGASYKYCVKDDGTLPTGLSDDGSIVKGTPTVLQDTSARFRLTDSYVSLWGDAYILVDFHVMEIPELYIVTYDAGIGTVNGSERWSETILAESYASLPDAKHSTGAYTFLGWSLSETSTNVVSGYTVTKDVTLHAVWQRNTVGISNASATIDADQRSVLPMVTDPSDAVLKVSGLGGLTSKNVWIVGHSVILDMTDVEPGTYYVTIDADYTGFLTGSSVITVMVPITIVKPIEYTLTEGDVFSYTPVTNPTNAAITLVDVTVDGAGVQDFGGLKVNGRTITGTLMTPGTYEIVYKASLDGYVDVTNNVLVYVSASSDVPVMGPVSLASITAASRADEPRVFDFVAIGGQNVTNYVWSVEGQVFASSSPTALYEFPSSGVYNVECTAYGASGDSVTLSVTAICTDNRHRDAAWVGVEYGYVVPGTVEVTLPMSSFLTKGAESIGGQVYTTITGTPSAGDVGKGIAVTVGSEQWTIKVYDAETSAPTATFTTSVGADGYTVNAIFTGSNASFHRFDFDGDGVYEDSSEFTYDRPGRYVISCIAVNNISEVTSSMRVEIDVAPSQSTDVFNLTDFTIGVNERLYIDIDVPEGGSMIVSGSATSFIEVVDNTLRVHPIEKGIYSLTVKVLRPDGTFDSRTVEVRVTGPDDIVPVDEETDYLVMVVLFVVSISVVCAVVIFDMHSGRISAWFSRVRMNRSRSHGTRGIPHRSSVQSKTGNMNAYNQQYNQYSRNNDQDRRRYR